MNTRDGGGVVPCKEPEKQAKRRCVQHRMSSNVRLTNEMAPSPTRDEALLALLARLKRSRYDFVTPTPATHARVISRAEQGAACDLRDVFGWSKPFAPNLLPSELLEPLHTADAVTPASGGLLKCRLRVSSLGGELFLHSAYPTDDQEAVFVGPDSYRFARFVTAELTRYPEGPGSRLVDIGAGAGVGAIVAGKLCPHLRIMMTDINSRALELARINARAAGVGAWLACGPNLDPVSGDLDVVLANPPYIIDPAGRDYRDGGDMHGGRVAYDMAAAALPRLRPGGRLLLYTGSAIIKGHDALRGALFDLARGLGCAVQYDELDPDVFGEELETPYYADVERIAVVGAVITRTERL